MAEQSLACAAVIEIDARQQYLLESDKLQEMLGASRIMDHATAVAGDQCRSRRSVHLFQPASGDLRVWAREEGRSELLDVVWAVREYLFERGVDHTVAYVDKVAAGHFLESRRPGTARVRTGADSEPPQPDLGWVHATLSRRATRRRAMRFQGDARPACSLFAPCQIHGLDAANHWNPGGNPREPRRELVGERARQKVRAWEEAKKPGGFYGKYLEQPIRDRARELLVGGAIDSQRPIVFSDLAEQLDDAEAGDQFIAFACTDTDGMGDLLANVDWNAPDWDGAPPEPWARNELVSRALADCVDTAFTAAVAEVVLPDRRAAEARARGTGTITIRLPILPQLLGGDDLWLVARRDVVFRLIASFTSRYQAAVDTSPAIKEALRIANRELEAAAAQRSEPFRPNRLTISSGIAFAKAGFPAHAMVKAAEDLISLAKARRKGHTWDHTRPEADGCVDWHWIESSLSETVDEARKSGRRYRSNPGDDVMLLTTRPWTIVETGAMIVAATEFSRVPRRKREQLEGILRRGYVPSLLAWEAWWKGLSSDEHEVMRAMRHNLPFALQSPDVRFAAQFDFEPWMHVTGDGLPASPRYFRTPLLDLLVLQDVIRARRPDERETGAGEEDEAETAQRDREEGSHA